VEEETDESLSWMELLADWETISASQIAALNNEIEPFLAITAA